MKEMEQSHIENNQETTPEIHTIPTEFYGGVKQGVPPIQAAKPPAVGIAPSAPKALVRGLAVPWLKNLKSPKIILIASLLVFVLVIGGFAFYYIRQANITRQKLLKPAPPAAEVTPPAEEAAPEAMPAPEISVTTTPPVVSVFPSAIFPFKNYIKTPDTDNDGLTDEEEKIFGTAPDKPDSDNDGYVDSLEVDNLYNPLGFKPVRLIDSGRVQIYLNPTYNYSIYYPQSWIPQALDANNKDVMFTAETGEFVEVLVEDNPLKMSAVDWYLGQSPGVAALQLESFQTKEKIEGIKSPDGLVAYIPFEDKIFVINYNIGLKDEVNFLNTFSMMANSFRPVGSLEDLPFGAATSTAASLE